MENIVAKPNPHTPKVLLKEAEEIQTQKEIGLTEQSWADNWTNGPDHHEND